MRVGDRSSTMLECARCHRRGRQAFVVRSGPDEQRIWVCSSRRACEERQTRRLGQETIARPVDPAAARAWLRSQTLIEQSQAILAKIADTRLEGT